MLQQLLMNREDFLKTVEEEEEGRTEGWRPLEASSGGEDREARSRTSAPQGQPIEGWADGRGALIGRTSARAEGSPGTVECPPGLEPLVAVSLPVVGSTSLATAGT